MKKSLICIIVLALSIVGCVAKSAPSSPASSAPASSAPASSAPTSSAPASSSAPAASSAPASSAPASSSAPAASSAPASSAPASSDTAASDTASSADHKIGDAFTINDVEYTVKGVRTGKGSTYSKPKKAEDVFIYVKILVSNKSSDTATVSSMLNFSLADLDGTSYNQAFTTDTVGKVDGSLAKGRKMTGEIAYEVPAKTKSFELKVSNNFSDPEYVAITVK